MTLIDKAEAPFFFDRYINGVRMAEDVCIERETTLEGAMRVAARIAAKGPNGEPPVLVYRTTDAAHVNEPPKSEHDAGNVLTDAAQAREAALSVLSGLSSYLGAGLGNDDTTPEQYDKRIRWGIDHQIAVTVQRCADVIEELSKEAYSGKRVPWGQIKQAILALSPAAQPGADVAAQAREAAFVLLNAMEDGEFWKRAVNAAMPIINADLNPCAWLTVAEAREAITAAIRAIGETRK